MVHARAGAVSHHERGSVAPAGCQAALTAPFGRGQSEAIHPCHHPIQMSGRFYLGTSGFAYDEWRKGVFYPEDLKKDDMLDYYSTQLSSVEINYTFRRFPTEKSLETGGGRPPTASFHAQGEPAHHALEEAQGRRRRRADVPRRRKALGDRFGCVLFQCPPSLHYDAALIDDS